MRKNNLYGNCVVFDPDGREVFRAGENKRRWYLDRGLAEELNDNNIRLNFYPKGYHTEKDTEYNGYLTAPKRNCCVVTGVEDHHRLTRHHIVPYRYRRHMPEEYKCNNYHDVVMLEVECHSNYESMADEFSSWWRQRFNVKIKPSKFERRLIKLHKAIENTKDTPYVQKYMEQLDQLGLSTDDLEQETNRLTSVYSDPSKTLVDRVLDSNLLDSFIRRWRAHFIVSLRPKHMPEGWHLMNPCKM